MSTANEAFLDALVRHQVGLMRLAPGISRQVVGLLNATERDIKSQILTAMDGSRRQQRLEGLLKAIRAVRSPAWKKGQAVWAEQLQGIAEHEPVFLDHTLRTVSPAVLELTLPTVRRMADIAKSTPFEGRVMSDWAQRQEAADLSRIEESIKIGLTQGESSQAIAKRIVGTTQFHGTDGVTQITRNNANAITRTAVNAISNAAKQEFYSDNADIFEWEIFLATLDSRTTLLCASKDHKRYRRGVGPIPPLHWNCRSMRMAIMDQEVIGQRPARNFTQRQLLREFAEQENIKVVTKPVDLPRGYKGEYGKFAQRRMRELTGPEPAALSYQQWLKNQTHEVQNDILGPSRAKLFRSGKITLDRFVDNGRMLTLEQLKQRELQ